MSKFKVGDRVRVVNTIDYHAPIVASSGVVTSVDSLGAYIRMFDEKGTKYDYYMMDFRLALAEKHPVIVITTDGVTTTATKRLGKKVLGTAYSKCAPADTFDYDTGVGLALARLCGFEIQIHEEEPKFPEKLVCVKARPNSDYTPGKVYKTIESNDPDFAHRVQGNDIGATWGIVEDGDGGYEVNVCKDNTFWASFIPFVED